MGIPLHQTAGGKHCLYAQKVNDSLNTGNTTHCIIVSPNGRFDESRDAGKVTMFNLVQVTRWVRGSSLIPNAGFLTLFCPSLGQN